MARELKDAGWFNARALVGGWEAWKQAGLAVKPREDPMVSLRVKE